MIGQVLSFSTNREEYDDAKSKLREVEKELYQIVRSIKSKANTLNIKYDVEVHHEVDLILLAFHLTNLF